LEGADDRDEAPSPASRARLRAAVATELGLDRRWSWWARPLALTAAAAALVIATTAVNHLATTPGAPPRSAELGRP
ncbi:hypothetical protein L6R52_19410, partial [Myxococcota bacterium]|nr:hypothetical protein [Myxococcota bacterium]